MPIVPGDPFVPSVIPQGQMIYNTIDRATPDAFGGQVGATLEQAGNRLMQHAAQRQQLANETNVNDVYANQFSPAHYLGSYPLDQLPTGIKGNRLEFPGSEAEGNSFVFDSDLPPKKIYLGGKERFLNK